MNSELRSSKLPDIAQAARRSYVARITEPSSGPWWTAVLITASSRRQAERYQAEIERRIEAGQVPSTVLYAVAPDLDDTRIGSGGATLNALRVLAEQLLPGAEEQTLEEWWNNQRVLLIHSGGDSRRLPEYSLAGKLFSALPIKTPWGEVSTVFDETLALSTAWAGRLSAGLVVSSGDVILTFDAAHLEWDKPGVCGVAMREPIAVGSQHGVYVIGDRGRVYSFLQKPSAAEVAAAGGMLGEEAVALDVGLLRFDATLAARLTELAGVRREGGRWIAGEGVLAAHNGVRPMIDLYEHMTLALTGEWRPSPETGPGLRAVSEALCDVPFWCSLVEGDFTHVGTTSHFRRLMTEDTSFSDLYTAQQRLGAVNQPGVQTAGVTVDSIFSEGGEAGAGSVVIECFFEHRVRAGRNAILHGLEGIPRAVIIPENTVVHQAPVRLDDGRRGAVIRVYGVADDPKVKLSDGATWFGRPMVEVLHSLELDPDQVWPETAAGERCLWNAQLFALGTVEEAWNCAAWLMSVPSGPYDRERWLAARRLSLASSAEWADSTALAEARSRRLQASWQLTAVALAESGTDIRPLLARSPGVAPLSRTGRVLRHQAGQLVDERPTEAASRYFQAGMFLGQAGLEEDAARARADAFRCVQKAVDDGCREDTQFAPSSWRHGKVRVAAPARVDFGGGWSDTPPFCLDWGGSVLNMAVTLNGEYPIATTITRLPEPVIRCETDGEGGPTILRDTAEITEPLRPGSPLAIPRAALRLLGVVREGEPLARRLAKLGGGIEIRTEANLPMGSGLGTSSILAATVLRALAEMGGIALTELELSDQVMRLEQLMTTGGGWQDQAGGIFPGAKLVTTGPGLRQRLRVQPLGWSAGRQKEFQQRFVLHYTGIRRVAKGLLAQVVGSYLAREVATVQVLHSIKTLAMEMSFAMEEGDWSYLGKLTDRHWRLNQRLDPYTTNAPIDSVLRQIRPFITGAKLAGAGGGGFLMLIARDPDQARALRDKLAATSLETAGATYDYGVATKGLIVEHSQ